MPDEQVHGARTDEPFLEINTNEDEGGGISTIIFIITIILTVLFTGFIVFYKYRLDAQVKDKTQSLASVIEQINSAENKKIEAQADDLNTATGIITTASKSKYSFNGFINDLTKKITNDVKLNSLSITDGGAVKMDGNSASYRSVADLAVALQSSKKLEEVKITGLSKDTNEGGTGIIFSLSAQVVGWKTITQNLDQNIISGDSEEVQGE